MSAEGVRKRGRVALVTHAALPQLAADDRLLAGALSAAGVEVVPVVWDRPGSAWKAFDAVILRSCWDYHLQPRAFAAWLDEMEAADVPLWNPPATVRWNMSKFYLRELEAMGVAIPETEWVPRGSTGADWLDLRQRGWERAVVKPAVSASAHRTRLVSCDDPIAGTRELKRLTREGDALVQAFLREVVGDGEWSLCYIAGRFSHAVLKRPRIGDFRVQVEYGGVAAAAEPPHVARAAASDLLARLALPWLYARVDGVVRNDRFVLLELEMIEPSLFLDACAEAPARLADGLLQRL